MNLRLICVVAVVMSLAFAGCGKREEAPASTAAPPQKPLATDAAGVVKERMADPEYRAELDAVKEQKRVAGKELQAAAQQLETAEARIRGTLKDSNDEVAFKSACKADVEWGKLKKILDEKEQAASAAHARARATIRERMIRQSEEYKAAGQEMPKPDGRP